MSYYIRSSTPDSPPLALIGTNIIDSYPTIITLTGHMATGKSVQLLGVWQRAITQAAAPIIFVDRKRGLRQDALNLVPASRRQALIELSEVDAMTLDIHALERTSLVYVSPTTQFSEAKPSPLQTLRQFIALLAATPMDVRPLLLIDEAQMMVDAELMQVLDSAQMTTILASQSPLPGIAEAAWSYAMWKQQGPDDGEPAVYPFSHSS